MQLPFVFIRVIRGDIIFFRSYPCFIRANPWPKLVLMHLDQYLRLGPFGHRDGAQPARQLRSGDGHAR